MGNIGIFIAVICVCALVTTTPATYGGNSSSVPYNAPCNVRRDVTKEYRYAIDEFVIATYKKALVPNGFHVVFAAPAMWTVLAAIAEGAEPQFQQELFKLLHLPDDACVRQQYYQLAASHLFPGPDISISNTKALIIDEGLTVNPDWHNYISRNSLLDVISAPIKSNPQVALSEMRRVISAKLPKLNMHGNSVLLESMDFSGLWNTAFPAAVVERAPFYGPNGQKIGAVDLMKMRKYVKMGYAPNLQAKVLGLPLGSDSRYTLLYAMFVGEGDALSVIQGLKGSVINEAWESLRESDIPLDVAVPRYTMTSEMDLRAVLEELGVKSLWNNSAVTRFVSEPAALPSSYVQRVTITLNPSGVNPTPFLPAPPADAPTGLDPSVGRDFIANQPHIVGLYDTQMRSCLMSIAFAQPTYLT